MSKSQLPKTFNFKSLFIGIISISIIFYSSALIVNTVNNGVKRYNLIENEQVKLNKLKAENEKLKTQLSQVGSIDDQTRSALNSFNLVDPAARIYMVKIPEEISYLDVKAEIESYSPQKDDRSAIQKFFDDLFGRQKN